jgi:hypothetical protein
MTKVDDVTVEDNVLLAFETQFAVLATGGERSPRDERFVADNLGSNETA